VVRHIGRQRYLPFMWWLWTVHWHGFLPAADNAYGSSALQFQQKKDPGTWGAGVKHSAFVLPLLVHVSLGGVHGFSGGEEKVVFTQGVDKPAALHHVHHRAFDVGDEEVDAAQSVVPQ